MNTGPCSTIRSGPASGLAMAFRMKLGESVSIDTRSHNPLTHWKQAFHPFPQLFHLTEGDRFHLSIDLTCSRHPFLGLKAILSLLDESDTLLQAGMIHEDI